MNLPTEQQCLDFFRQYHVPPTILKHCLVVRKASVFLAQKLKDAGAGINLELIDRAALLHDLFKVVVLKTTEPNQHHPYLFTAPEKAMWRYLRKAYPNMHESEVAYLFFKDDYPELASTIKRAGNPRVKDPTLEESLIQYADHRVLRCAIVTLAERIVYLKEMYPKDDIFWNRVEKESLKLEQQIFSQINLQPEQLADQIKAIR